MHKPFAVKAAARAVKELGVDHVVLTGDLSNLALEVEFALVRRFLTDDLGLAPEQVSLVPGNHDVYTRGAHGERRFERTFTDFLQSDLPELRVSGEAFPFVHLRGPAAIIGLSSAVPRPPLMAAGALGRPQLDALRRVLAHPEVAKRTPVILQHHPIHNPEKRVKRFLEGLDDAEAEAEVLAPLHRGLILHGHLHRRVHRKLATAKGHLDAVGATSTSLLHDSDERMGGFNVYEISDDGAVSFIGSQRLDEGERFREVAIPRAV